MLKGLKVIDFSNYLPGPYASMRLAELGAEIIKVEPETGDPARHLGVKIENSGVVFLANNRMKKSITLNLKEKEGREIALKLISEADAILESFRPGVMKKLGLDFESVLRVKPDIVYCSLTGYGDRGSLSNLGSHDLNYMAVSGALSQLKDKNGKPVHPTNTIADYIGGIAASERILAGIAARSMTGEGSYTCISIAEVMASLMGNHLLIEKETGSSSGISVLNGEIISYCIYETKDSRYVAIAALEPKFWENFCRAQKREDWIQAHFSKAKENNPVFEQVKELFRSRTLEEWTEFGQQADCCLTPVLETNELEDFPFYKEKDTIFYSGNNFKFVKMHGDVKAEHITLPPDKGEHTESILKEVTEKTEHE